jgi:hypothetical protein
VIARSCSIASLLFLENLPVSVLKQGISDLRAGAWTAAAGGRRSRNPAEKRALVQLHRPKNQLDAELQSAGPNVGIAFGIELFEEFDERRWLTLETFGVSALFPARMPAYARTHCALRTWDVANREFRVGRDKNGAATVAASPVSGQLHPAIAEQ